MLADVLIEISAKGLNKTFSYLIPDNLNVIKGIRVLVPFGKKVIEGFVLDIKEREETNYELKEIIETIDDVEVLNSEMLELGHFISKKYFSGLISAYQTMLPVGLKAKKNKRIGINYDIYYYLNNNINELAFTKKQLEIIKHFKNNGLIKKEDFNYSISVLKNLIAKNVICIKKVPKYRINKTNDSISRNIVLTDKQMNIVDSIYSKKSTFSPFLLHGVTGSGKTEVYIELTKKIIRDNKEVIILVPEISLTPQFISRFEEAFGNNIAVLHSGLSDGEKYDEWRKIKNKDVSITIGARSAIFAPFENIGLIIIDEEHSDTYKQENNPKYSAIDVALHRGKKHNCPVVLGSATPSIDSYTKCKLGIYTLLELKSRVNACLPKVYTVDMKNEIKKGNKIFSEILSKKINECISNNHQAIILLNRRGYSTTISCHDCGVRLTCPKCDIPLTYHKNGNYLLCHYCNYRTYKPKICPNCKGKSIDEFGIGTERLEFEIKKTFEKANVIRMDTDTTTKKGSHEKIIDDFKHQKYNILVGTQMIAKGLDFDNVTLVGVINADSSLNIPDFRSAERTYNLLSQVAGRAGRGSKNGEVYMQGFNMNHYSISAACMHDYKSFYNTEIKIRKQLNYPPYFNLCVLKTSYKNENELIDENDKIIKYLTDMTKDCIILGPSPCSISKVNNIYYYQIIIKYKKRETINEQLKFLYNYYSGKKIRFDIDVNPYHI